MNERFTVLLPVYALDHPERLSVCLESITRQVPKPQEIVIVIDGPIGGKLKQVIHDYAYKKNLEIAFRIILNEINLGLGRSLSKGVLECSNDLIARMDADDEVVDGRFTRQTMEFEANPDLVLVGGHICEVEDTMHKNSTEQCVRRGILGVERIRNQAPFRNPFNHMTVMFRKSAVLKVGNYRPVPCFEDYYLWMRMLKAGYHMDNIDSILVRATIGNGMIKRRSGFDYVVNEIKFFKRLLEENLISSSTYMKIVAVRLPLRLLPERLLRFVYQDILRDRYASGMPQSR
ncbi:glycosyltransferase [Pseudobacteriovorax antillogorgiicola]|uniref:Glycosyl transferase family 2 n=1 Tax=Pseudobacteriovorax antillogorgiicola TaxID=1513793 RepID=A0A1Y6CT52_9BACT|nr:glycosyltransferase [Pseudobacteriovorax antillogorgiicola]TCS45233.1 glycosyl transferase family 2 [Pseudobacteriovorax antillogorgiicola]SMF75332.1 Glycosyl transferase family 2 [Pseudobacteriovorax antillogorgiicola]